MAAHALKASSLPPQTGGRFGAGLNERDIGEFQAILREESGLELSLPEAWSRAIEALSLVELLLTGSEISASERAPRGQVRASSHLTDVGVLPN